MESSSASPRDFPHVLRLGAGLVTIVYAIFASLSYLAFGSATHDLVTLNLDGRVGACVQACVAVGLLLTFPIMTVPIFEVSDRFFRSVRPGSPNLLGPREGEGEGEEEEGDGGGENRHHRPRAAILMRGGIVVAIVLTAWVRIYIYIEREYRV